MAKEATHDVTLRLPTSRWAKLASIADDRGIDVKSVLLMAMDKIIAEEVAPEEVAPVEAPTVAATPPPAPGLRGFEVPRLPRRVGTPIAREKSLIIEAASQGWTTSEILASFPEYKWSRGRVNHVRREAGYPASAVNHKRE